MTKFNKVIIMLFLIIFSVICISLYIGNNEFRNFVDVRILGKEVRENNLKAIYSNTNTTTAIMNFGRNTAILENGELKIYDKDAKMKNSIKMVIGSPLYYSNERYLGITDKNGTKIHLIEDDKLKWEKRLELPVEKIHVNKSGYVTVVTKNSIYKGVVYVYKNTGELLIKSYVSSGNIIDAELSEDNKFLAIADIDYSKVTISSNVKVINIDKGINNPEEAIVNEYVKGSLLVNIKFKDDGNLLAQYVDSVELIGLVKDKNKEIYKVEKNKAVFVDIDSSNGFVLVEKENEGIFKTKYKVRILNSEGKNKAEYNLSDLTPKQIKSAGEGIAINTGSELVVISLNGWVKKRYKTNKEIQRFTYNDYILSIISSDKIEIIEV